jgi:acetyltransferase-like isoleucine patch superfamily enzyme
MPFVTDARDLTKGLWTLRTPKLLLSAAVSFSRDGRIVGSDAAPRSQWDFHEGRLRFIDAAGKVTAALEPGEDGTYTGLSLLGANNTLILEPTTWEERPRWPHLTRNQLKDQIARHGWDVGDHTYGKPAVSDVNGDLSIGKFVSMDAGIIILLAERRTDSAATYPFQALRKWWPNGSFTTDRVARPVVIGNDVRIGQRVVINSGVTIGDGAVIRAQAVVTEDVPPYAIVEGNPALVTEMRFDDETIRRLLAVAWWDWPDEAINEFLPLMGADIQTFLKEAERLGL